MRRSFLLAVQFLTRIPVAVPGDFHPDDMAEAAGFFPLVGLLLGLWGVLLCKLFGCFVPHSTAVWMTLVVLELTTGGFHEDGLADAFDGLGGGWTRDRKLEIMRDSRIGSYGAIALVLLFVARYDLLRHLGRGGFAPWMIFASTAGRWSILPLCMWLPYARSSSGQGEKVAHRIDGHALARGTVALVFASCALPWGAAPLAWLVTLGVLAGAGLVCERHLGGITGDCLGATHVITEVLLLTLGLALQHLGPGGW